MGSASSSASTLPLVVHPPHPESFEGIVRAWQADRSQSSLDLRRLDLDHHQLQWLLQLLEHHGDCSPPNNNNRNEHVPLTSLTLPNCAWGETNLSWRQLMLQFVTTVATTQPVDTLDFSFSNMTDELVLQILRVWSTTNTRRRTDTRKSSTISFADSNESSSFRVPSEEQQPIPRTRPQPPPPQLVVSSSSLTTTTITSIAPLVALDLSRQYIESTEIWRILQQEFPALRVLHYSGCCDVSAVHCFVQGAFFSTTTTTRNEEVTVRGGGEEQEDDEQRRSRSTNDFDHRLPDGDFASPPDRRKNKMIFPPPRRPYWPALQHLDLACARYTLGHFRQLVVGLCCHPSQRQPPPQQQQLFHRNNKEQSSLLSPLVSFSQHTNLLSGRRVLRWLQYHDQQQRQDRNAQPPSSCCCSSASASPAPAIALKSLSLRGARDLGVTALSWLALLVAHQPELKDLNVSFAPDLFRSWIHTSRYDLRQLQVEEEEEHERRRHQQEQQHGQPARSNNSGTMANRVPPPNPPRGVPEQEEQQPQRRRLSRRRVISFPVLENNEDGLATTTIDSYQFRRLRQPFFECFAFAVGKHRKLQTLSLRSSDPNDEMAMALFRHLEEQEGAVVDGGSHNNLRHHKPSLHTLDISRNKNMKEFALVKFIASLPRMTSLRAVNMSQVPFWNGLTAAQRNDLVKALDRNHSLCDFRGAPAWLLDHYSTMPPSPELLSHCGGAHRHKSNKDKGNNSSTTRSLLVPYLNYILARNRALYNARQMLQSVERNRNTNLTTRTGAERPAVVVQGDRSESAGYDAYVTAAWPVWLEQLARHHNATPPSSRGGKNKPESNGQDSGRRGSNRRNRRFFFRGPNSDNNEYERRQTNEVQPRQQQDLSERQPPPPSWVASAYFVVLQSQQWDWIPL